MKAKKLRFIGKLKRRSVKLKLLLAGVFLFISSHAIYAQAILEKRITASYQASSLIQRLKDIQKDAKTSFAFDEKETGGITVAAASFTNAPLKELLQKTLNDLPFDWRVVGESVVIMFRPQPAAVRADPGKISGNVTDAISGIPLPGATVRINHRYYITDENGMYLTDALNEGQYNVEVSFVGYTARSQKQRVKAGSTETLNIALRQEVGLLDAIVVIGYGTSRKKELTTSVASIRDSDLNQGIYTNPVEALQGKVAGLNITSDGDPNSVPTVILRGPSTLRIGDAQQPLYVIDGIPGGLMPVPEDVLSIDVLRDASATAIYGARAANGVILITTKKGKSGQTKVSFSSRVGWESVSNKIEMLSAEEYLQYLADNNLGLSPNDEHKGASTNWFDEVSRTGVSFNHNLSVSGGNERTNYYSSINYLQKEGIIKKSSMNQVFIRAGLEHKTWNDRLTLGITTAQSLAETQTVHPSIYLTMWKYLPTVNIYDADGNYHENLERALYNPVATIEQNTFDSKSKTFFGTAKAQLNLLPGLDYDVNVSYRNGQSTSGTYYSKKSVLAYGLNGSAARSTTENAQRTLETFLTYRKKLDTHQFRLLGGYSWQSEESGDGFSA
ncbi:MAG: carboxypeptidase-like regulatory domain-containing protein, partial [Leadbetterella sp.]|nr:carboxypeptidase-like regulatory domain-containing protein [Leadbetterella sp.]